MNARLLCATTDAFQCFPLYTYSEDGSDRQENITDWALNEFRNHYHDPNITKWDSSTTSMPCCITPTIASVTPPT